MPGRPPLSSVASLSTREVSSQAQIAAAALAREGAQFIVEGHGHALPRFGEVEHAFVAAVAVLFQDHALHAELHALGIVGAPRHMRAFAALVVHRGDVLAVAFDLSVRGAPGAACPARICEVAVRVTSKNLGDWLPPRPSMPASVPEYSDTSVSSTLKSDSTSGEPKLYARLTCCPWTAWGSSRASARTTFPGIPSAAATRGRWPAPGHPTAAWQLGIFGARSTRCQLRIDGSRGLRLMVPAAKMPHASCGARTWSL